MSAGETQGAPKLRIQSVERAVNLLLLVASRKTDGTCKGLATAAGLATPTTHHLLGTLVAQGLLARDAQGRYVLGVKVAILVDAFHRDLATPGFLLAPLQQLAGTTGETTYLLGWRNGDIQMIGMADGSLPVRVSLPALGPYADAHARAGGKVLLAYAPDSLRDAYLMAHPVRALTPHTVADPTRLAAELDEIRRLGYAIEEEQFLQGVSCISVPVLHDGVLVAAYSMSVPSQRFVERTDELIRALLSTTRSVEQRVASEQRSDERVS